MVNFTFVSHQWARPEKSELVKSHVMRESQKRRREAKQHHRHDIAPSFGGLPIRAPAGRTAALRESKTASDGPLSFYTVPEKRSFDNNYSPISSSSSTSGTVGSTNHERISLRTSPRPANSTQYRRPLESRPRTVFEGKPVTGASFRLDPDGRLYAPSPAPAPASTHESGISRPQFQYLIDPNDPSWMPETWFNRVKEIVSHYTLSFGASGPDTQSILSHWLKQARDSPLMLLACSLFYCAHRDLVSGIVGNDHHYFKARSLQLINAALENPATALAEETILAVTSMAMYENLRGSRLVVTHERGLRQMFDMRGGVQKRMSEEGFYIGNLALLQLDLRVGSVDMIHSSCSNEVPLFLEVKDPVLRDGHKGTPKTFFPQSPLRAVNSAGVSTSVSIPELRSSLDVLRDAFDAFEMLCIEVSDAETAAREAALFKLRRERCWARLQAYDSPGSEETSSTTEGNVEEAVRIAGTIHFCAVVSRIGHDDAVNTEYASRLHVVLKKLRLDFWKTVPYLYLWMLLTGGAASSRLPEHRPYFVSEIIRVGVTFGFFDRHAFNQSINNFLWLQAFLRKHGEMTTGAGVNAQGSR